MQTFTFFMLERPREVPAFIFDAFPDAEAAVDFGRTLLTSRNRYRAVEVIQDDKRIAWLEAIAPASEARLQSE